MAKKGALRRGTSWGNDGHGVFVHSSSSMGPFYCEEGRLIALLAEKCEVKTGLTKNRQRFGRRRTRPNFAKTSVSGTGLTRRYVRGKDLLEGGVKTKWQELKKMGSA